MMLPRPLIASTIPLLLLLGCGSQSQQEDSPSQETKLTRAGIYGILPLTFSSGGKIEHLEVNPDFGGDYGFRLVVDKEGSNLDQVVANIKEDLPKFKRVEALNGKGVVEYRGKIGTSKVMVYAGYVDRPYKDDDFGYTPKASDKVRCVLVVFVPIEQKKNGD